MKLTIKIAVTFLLGLIIIGTDAQTYSIGEIITINSEILGEERGIIVYTPFSYTETKQTYPVMYLLDGDAHFHHASGIVQFMSSRGLMPEMIVVAIQNVDRTRDFSPTRVAGQPNTGGADNFMHFLSDELIPLVEKKFRANPYRILTGHSFGGEFAVFALLNEPDLFDAYIAISPYLMYDNNYMVKEARAKLRSNYPGGVMFYMTVGDEPNYFEPLGAFETIIEEKSPVGFEFKYVKMPDENHGSIPHMSIYKGLEWIYSGWGIPDGKINDGLDAINQHYADLSKKYGYEIKSPEYVLNLLGYAYLQNEEFEDAIRVFQENVKRYPESSNVYDSLGEAFENNNQFKEALKSYKKAVKIGSREMSHNLVIYTTNMERMKEKLSE